MPVLVPVGDISIEDKVQPVVGKLLPINSSYSAWILKRAFWRNSYNGGDEYPLAMDGKGRPMLWQHMREDPDTYAIRKDTAKCPNFCGPIVRMFNDFGFRKKPDRDKDGPPEYQDLIANADGYGLCLDDFMRKWLQKAQVEQTAFCMPVNPIDDGLVIKTKAEAKTAGAAPRLMVVGADQVVNWSRRGGELYEALIMLEIDGKAVARYLTETTRQDFQLKRAPMSDRQRGKSSYTVTKAGPTLAHGYPGLPLIPLTPMPDDLCSDLQPQAQVAPMADQQQDYLNVQSWLREELWNCVFTQYWVAGARPPSKTATGGSDNDEAKIGASRWMWFPSDKATLNRTSADPAASQRLTEQLDKITSNIYRSAGLESEDPIKVKGEVQSGIALAFRFQNLQATLAALVDSCERAENKVWHLLEDAWGFTIPKDTVYPDDFDVPNYAEELAGLIQALATNGLPSLLREKLVDRFAGRNLNLSQEDQDELDKQMEQRSAVVEAGASAFPPPEQTGAKPPPKAAEPPTPGNKGAKK